MAINLLLYCDNAYISNHLQLMLGGESRKYKLFLFTEASAAANYALNNRKKIHCVLATKEFMEDISSICSDVVLIALDEETRREEKENEFYSVNIYQNKKKILNDIEEILQHVGLVSIKNNVMRKTKVISFFSTQGGSGKTTLAYLTACRAAEHGNVAFLDLQPDPCSGCLYQTKNHNRAEEALFQIQDRVAPEILLSLFCQNEHGVNVMPTPESLLDQAAIKSDDFEYLISCLLNSGVYDFILIDLGSALSDVERMAIDNSDCVAMVYDESRMGLEHKNRLERDPNYHLYPLSEKEIWVENRCKEDRKCDERTVRFPVSGSVGKISDVKEVLSGNHAFAQGCEKILAIAKR